MLKFLEKYNWWTKNKSQISIESKIEYLLQYGTLHELKKAISEIGSTTIKNVWKERNPKVSWVKTFRYYLETH